jgi:hypothetical protein
VRQPLNQQNTWVTRVLTKIGDQIYGNLSIYISLKQLQHSQHSQQPLQVRQPRQILFLPFWILLGKIEQIQSPETAIITETPAYVGAHRRRTS